jgi:hypothetical protein
MNLQLYNTLTDRARALGQSDEEIFNVFGPSPEDEENYAHENTTYIQQDKNTI